MRKQYASPPVYEVLAELRFPDDTPWDIAVPGLIYERIKERFPERRERVAEEGIVLISAGELQQPRTTTIALFYTKDFRGIVQVGPRLLVINKLRPYGGWEQFSEYLRCALDALDAVVSPERLEALSLRYINVLEIEEEPSRLNSYLNFRPEFEHVVTGEPTRFAMACEFATKNGRDACRIRINGERHAEDEPVYILLDLQCELIRREEVEPKNALHWLEEAHEELSALFEACITDRLRETFQGENKR